MEIFASGLPLVLTSDSATKTNSRALRMRDTVQFLKGFFYNTPMYCTSSYKQSFLSDKGPLCGVCRHLQIHSVYTTILQPPS